MKNPGYSFIVSPLSEEDGDGWIVTFPDLPGCIATGRTEIEAVTKAQDALTSYIKSSQESGAPLPEPGEYSEKFRLRVPKGLHSRLASRAEADGSDINTLVMELLDQGLSLRQGRKT